MTFEQLFKQMLTDIKVKLHDEFDRNFERKAFFDKPWPKNKLINHRGSAMIRSGNLRRGYTARVEGSKIVFSNALPYAALHNNGGYIVVTPKMKRYFWAMYYQSMGGMVFSIKTRNQTKTKKNTRLSMEAQQYKAMALMPIGRRIKIEARPVIGDHPKVKKNIERIVNDHLKDLNKIITQNIKK